MKQKYYTMTLIFLTFILHGEYAQAQKPDLTGVTINTYHVAGNVYMLEATGDVAGNIGVSAGPDGILLVDTQFAELADQITSALKKINSGEIKFVINTHYHDDHADGNRVFGKTATIIATSQARELLKTQPKTAWPDITFDDSLSVFFNGEEIKIIHFPNAHTGTDAVVFFTGSNVVHLGDLWNSGISSFPNVDLESGGSITGMLDAVEKLITLIPPDAKIIPGHYEISNLDALKVTRDMLAETIGIVRAKKEAGMSLEQVKKEGLPPKYDDWGTAFTNAESWIENIYRGLDKN